MATELKEPAVEPVRFLHVKVVDHSREDRTAVNVKMPISVVRWGMKMAKAFAPEMKDVDVDWNEVTEALKEGGPQKIVEVEDEAENKTVEVWVD
jgi:hypothetical protein